MSIIPLKSGTIAPRQRATPSNFLGYLIFIKNAGV
jgi:hypothetical protein